jgi:hypothetical protein
MPASPRCTEAQHFPLHLPAGESCLSCGRAWIPSSSTEWQSTTLQELEDLPPIVHRDPVLPTVTVGEYSHPNPSSLT